MPIATADLDWYFSVKTGSAGDTTAGTAAGSLGKYCSTTEWTGGTLHDLFDAVTGDENAASEAEYRCVFVRNNHATLTLTSAKVYFNGAQTAGGANLEIGLDPAGVSDADQVSAQAAEVADENTAPSGVSWSAPTTKAASTLSIASLAPDAVQAVWIKRTAANSAAASGDGGTLRIEGDTPA